MKRPLHDQRIAQINNLVADGLFGLAALHIPWLIGKIGELEAKLVAKDELAETVAAINAGLLRDARNAPPQKG